MMTVHGEARQPQQLVGASSSRAQFGIESFAAGKPEPASLSLVSFKAPEAHEGTLSES